MMMEFRLNTVKLLKNPELQLNVLLPWYPATKASSESYSLCGRKTSELEDQICKAWKCLCPIKPGSYQNNARVKVEKHALLGLINAAIYDTKVYLRIKDGGTPLFCGMISYWANRKTKSELSTSVFRDELNDLCGESTNHEFSHSQRISPTWRKSSIRGLMASGCSDVRQGARDDFYPVNSMTHSR